MQTQRAEALRTIPTVDFIGCPDIRRLALPVGLVGVVFASHTEIVEADAAKAMRARRDDDNTRVAVGGGRRQKHRLEQMKQEEMRQVVISKLRLEAIGCPALRTRHYAGIFDQDVECLALGLEVVRAGAHRCNGVQVEV